jgi:hypothetical protein
MQFGKGDGVVDPSRGRSRCEGTGGLEDLDV